MSNILWLMAVPESPYCSILWDQPENIVSPRVDTSPAFIHCLVHTSETRCIRTISDMTEWHYVTSAYFCCWCFAVDSLVSFDLFSMQVTLLSFSVESESTFLDYIKGGWVERQIILLSCCSVAVNHTYYWILILRQLQGGSHDYF